MPRFLWSLISSVTTLLPFEIWKFVNSSLSYAVEFGLLKVASPSAVGVKEAQ